MTEFDATKFLVWWFDTHYILSTLITPFWSFLWALYNNLTVRAVVCALPTIFSVTRFVVELLKVFTGNK